MNEETAETTIATDVAETTNSSTESVETLDGLIELIQSQRSMLANSNQKNADTFNQLQKFITEKTTGVSELDGAISAVAGFVSEETPSDDEHVVRLTELQTERARTVEQLQNADTQRRNVFNSITMTEGALQILSQVLTSAGLVEESVETEEGSDAETE